MPRRATACAARRPAPEPRLECAGRLVGVRVPGKGLQPKPSQMVGRRRAFIERIRAAPVVAGPFLPPLRRIGILQRLLELAAAFAPTLRISGLSSGWQRFAPRIDGRQHFAVEHSIDGPCLGKPADRLEPRTHRRKIAAGGMRSLDDSGRHAIVAVGPRAARRSLPNREW